MDWPVQEMMIPAIPRLNPNPSKLLEAALASIRAVQPWNLFLPGFALPAPTSRSPSHTHHDDSTN
jgi:hypothetical protein